MRGILISIGKCGVLTGFRDWGVRIEDTRHPGLKIIRGSEDRLIGLLESWRIGTLPMYPILLARPFDYESILNGTYIYSISQPINHFTQKLLLTGSEPRFRRIRVRVRGHGLRISNTIRSEVNAILRQYHILHSRRSSIILSIEALRSINGVIRLYFGLYPKRYYIRNRVIAY